MPYLTPETIPAARISRRIRIPNDPLIVAAVNGAVSELSLVFNWELFGAITPDEIAVAMYQMYLDYEASTGMSFVGMVFPYLSTTPPVNCLLCDSTVYDKVDYPELAAVLAGSALDIDADTFMVPDADGRFVRGTITQANIGTVGGADTAAIDITNLPSHDHSVHSHGVGLAVAPGELPVSTPGLFDTATGSTGGDTPIDIIPPAFYAAWMVVAL